MDARAVITDGKGRFTVESIQVGDPQAGEVMVDIKASGVCHTDHKFMFRDIVQILGHEGAGVVRKAGPGVTGLAPATPPGLASIHQRVKCGAGRLRTRQVLDCQDFQYVALQVIRVDSGDVALSGEPRHRVDQAFHADGRFIAPEGPHGAHDRRGVTRHHRAERAGARAHTTE